MEEIFIRWRPYIDEQYISKMKDFFEDVYYKRPTGKLFIIKGQEKTGKTTFVSEIVDILGNSRISHICDFIDKDLIFISEPQNNSKEFSPTQINNIKNKLEEKKSLIMICNNINIPCEIEKYCEIVEFNHIFTNNNYSYY